MFQLTVEEAGTLSILKLELSKGRGRGGRRYLPYVFTEQGVAMLSGVFCGAKRAVQINVEIMRAFVRLRSRMLASNEDLARKLACSGKEIRFPV